MEGRGGDSRTVLERAGSAAAGITSFAPKNPAARIAFQWGLAALIFGFLVFFVVRQWNDLPDFDWHFEAGWLALSAVAVLLFYTAQGELWRLIVHSLWEGRLEPTIARAIWGKSLLARYVPTNALMVVGRMVMAEREGLPKRICLASIVYELGLGFGTAVIVGAYFVIELPDLQDEPARYAVLALIPVVLAGLHPRIFFPLANFGLRKLGREPLPRALPFGRVLRLALCYAACWATIGTGLYAFASALTPLDAADYPYVAAAYPVAFCVAVLTFVVPSGLGTRDAALAIALKAVMGSTVATAIAVAFRIFQTAIELLYVGAVTWLGRRAYPSGAMPPPSPPSPAGGAPSAGGASSSSSGATSGAS
jgi:Lysylphosphatidylglycerol synthase TM region